VPSFSGGNLPRRLPTQVDCIRQLRSLLYSLSRTAPVSPLLPPACVFCRPSLHRFGEMRPSRKVLVAERGCGFDGKGPHPPLLRRRRLPFADPVGRSSEIPRLLFFKSVSLSRCISSFLPSDLFHSIVGRGVRIANMHNGSRSDLDFSDQADSLLCLGLATTRSLPPSLSSPWIPCEG